MKTNARTRIWTRVCSAVMAVMLLGSVAAGEPAMAKVTFKASDLDVGTVIATLSTLSGERYQPDVELMVAGINRTQATLSLVDAVPDSCRQAVAFALDCWWARDFAGATILSTSTRLPQGTVEVRLLTSTLRRDPLIQRLVARLMDPWLVGPAGVSYLPSEAQWTATLDQDGHRRLVELLSLYEQPLAQAASRVADPWAPDLRRLTTRELSVHSWPTLVEELAQVMQVSVALSPRLRLRPFPSAVMKLSRQSLGAVTDNLRSQGIAAHWRHGVLCLGEASTTTELVERQHPAQRRQLAIIPLGHLLKNQIDGELVVETLRRQIVPRAWDLPGAGIEFLAASSTVLVAGDADAHQAVLDAIGVLDTLGVDLGLQAISGKNP